MAYVALTNCGLILLNKYGIFINIWITRLLCLTVAFSVGKIAFLTKKINVIITIFVVVLFATFTNNTPVSLNPENYILVTILLICQITIKTSILIITKKDSVTESFFCYNYEVNKLIKIAYIHQFYSYSIPINSTSKISVENGLITGPLP